METQVLSLEHTPSFLFIKENFVYVGIEVRISLRMMYQKPLHLIEFHSTLKYVDPYVF